MNTSDDDASVADPYIVFTSTTPSGHKVRPSNWMSRLDDIVSAHWRGRSGHAPCGPCARCSEGHCYVVHARLVFEEPDLADDLLFAARMVGAAEREGNCPRGMALSALEVVTAASETPASEPEAA